jgi:hypothetical protein
MVESSKRKGDREIEEGEIERQIHRRLCYS